METGAGRDGMEALRGEAEGARYDALGSGRFEVQRVRVTKEHRKRDPRRRSLLKELPLDPRDPDIATAKRLQRKGVY